jgi:hypothetical protein
MHKSATKCNETVGKWCKNKHGASKIIDTLEMYHEADPRVHLHEFYRVSLSIKLVRYNGSKLVRPHHAPELWHES